MKKRSEICPYTGLQLRIRRQSNWWELKDIFFRASFEISIGNRHCSSRFLECQLYWAESRFDSFELSIGDTLRKYNYMVIGHHKYGVLGLEQAEQIAMEEGDKWIRENIDHIRKCLDGKQFELIQWEKWKQDPKFHSTFMALRNLYESSDSFKRLVHSDIDIYIERRRKRRGELSLPDLEDAKSILSMYLLEELAVYQIQAEARPTVNIYPGDVMQVFKRSGEIEGFPQSLVDRHFAYLELSEPKSKEE